MLKFIHYTLVGLIVIIVVLINGCGGVSSRQTNNLSVQSDPYLVQPTGAYAVGFKDYNFINTNLCPDPLYSESTAQYFSQNNPNYCHQLLDRVYYPIQKHNESTTMYDPYLIQLTQSLAQGIFKGNVPESIALLINQFSQTYSVTSANAPLISESSFPIVIFVPWLGGNAQQYQNMITQLVSNGYIVIAINSEFVSNLILPNNTISPSLLSELPPCSIAPIPLVPICNESQIATELQIIKLGRSLQTYDINYTLNQFKTSINSDSLAAIMDFTHIGAVGHSIGSQTIIEMAHSNPSLFQAAAAFDPFFPTPKGGWDPIESFSLPFLIATSAAIIPYTSGTLSLNNYFIGLTPSNTNHVYSNHANFTDLSTLQYAPLFPAIAPYAETTPDTLLNVGVGNGYDIANAINTYLLQFFNMYLKNQGNQNFNNCSKLTNNTFMTCGPGNFSSN